MTLLIERNLEPRLLNEPRGGVPDVTDTREGYRDACVALASASGPLAADAERASGFRYGHEDWLIQFKRGDSGIILLDPVALTKAGVSWHTFNTAVGDAEWIIHDAMMDLPGFTDIGLTPKRLFDTEMAARLLGLHRFGLAAVTEHYLGLVLAKEHSAADWSYRPLPRDWRNYAALDVEELIELEELMRADLRRAGKEEWAEEEFAHILAEGTSGRPRHEHPVPWLRISHITEIIRDPRALAVARALWTKRDELARRYDISPPLLLEDSSIIEAAKRKPRNAREFRAVRCLNERVRMHTGSEQDKMFERYAPIQRSVKPSLWKTVIQEALALPASELPSTPGGRDPKDGPAANAPRSNKQWERHPERMERLKRVRSVVNQIAEDTRTPVEIIVNPQIIRNLCWTDEPETRDVAEFLTEQGARRWQVRLIAASVERVIL
ncbi:HRDC domain-containing protein [Bifidobacterium sp. CP2]|uniref:HRDC domain-containing protein n=1 Tax=Bifidobacterium sp. CP2 TaxID=2809025 RepID=UPI001BDBEFCD|nr:HRDC domain-containing protein [Bifidobacterium sp. CP2]MBT1181864.1 HRDC domain-containing protein [Bifidobacterium sp. CP2]